MSSKLLFLLVIVLLLSACLDEGVAPHSIRGDDRYDIKVSSSSVKSSSSLANSSSSLDMSMSSSSEISSSSSLELSSSSSFESISSSSEDGDFVRIGNQEWTTRNLNINVSGSSCYNDNPENCEKYGRIYTWSMAMGIDISYDRKKYGTTNEPHQGICPSGSHLPSHEEWDQLNEFVLKHPEYATYFQNQYGGAYDYRGYYRDEGTEALFMSSTEYDVSGTIYYYEFAWLWAIHKGSSHFDNDNGHKYTGAYVRCVKDLPYYLTSSSSENLVSSSSETSSSSSVKNSSSSFQDNESSSSSEYIFSDEEMDFVKIGNQEWTTRNLNFNVTGSSCYKNNPENCEKYGRIYTWSMAMGIDISYDRKKYGTTNEPHQGICPSGSHLPSHEEWTQLNEFVKENPEYATYFQNQYGGVYDYRGYYRDEGTEALFMSSTEYDVSGTIYYYEFAWLWAIHKGSTHFDNDNGHKYTGAYVRCVKNL